MFALEFKKNCCLPDLFLIDNTISTLDKMSKSLIPILSKGSCVITGTAFDLPLVMQVDYINDKENRPDSDDVDLRALLEHRRLIQLYSYISNF